MFKEHISFYSVCVYLLFALVIKHSFALYVLIFAITYRYYLCIFLPVLPLFPLPLASLTPLLPQFCFSQSYGAARPGYSFYYLQEKLIGHHDTKKSRPDRYLIIKEIKNLKKIDV